MYVFTHRHVVRLDGIAAHASRSLDSVLHDVHDTLRRVHAPMTEQEQHERQNRVSTRDAVARLINNNRTRRLE